jgi:hypothetical protein
MFSVVIPTMWKSETFEEELNSICSSFFVDDIIIINNNIIETPNYDILNHHKILIVKPPDNIIVNPSWNLGVRLSKNNNICLLNDDILFNYQVFEFMSNNLDKHICGLNMYTENNHLQLIEAEKRIHGFGCMMFIRKDLYEYIPESIKLFYGDDYIFKVNQMLGRKNYLIDGCKNNETWGVTSKSGVSSCNFNLLNQIDNESKEIIRLINEKSNILHTK